MISSKIKNNIYALISLSTIVITVISFVFISGFLVKMNNSVFNVDDKLAEERNTVLNIAGFERIKDRIHNSDTDSFNTRK
jgi:uncharacterized membrane protein